MLKSYRVGWWGGVVAHEILVSAQGPLVLGLGLKGFGLRVWGQGLTIRSPESSLHTSAQQFFIIFLPRYFIQLPLNT